MFAVVYLNGNDDDNDLIRLSGYEWDEWMAVYPWTGSSTLQLCGVLFCAVFVVAASIVLTLRRSLAISLSKQIHHTRFIHFTCNPPRSLLLLLLKKIQTPPKLCTSTTSSTGNCDLPLLLLLYFSSKQYLKCHSRGRCPWWMVDGWMDDAMVASLWI